jgi:hypothetical protein
MSLVCFSNIDGNYQTLLTQLIDVNKLFVATKTGDGHSKITYCGPPHTTIVIVGNWIPKKSTEQVNWNDLALICSLLTRLKKHLVLICGRREYNFTMTTLKNSKKSYYKEPTPMDFFDAYWVPTIQNSLLYYVHEQQYLISYAPFDTKVLKDLCSYDKPISRIWKAGVKYLDIETMRVFENAFESTTMITRPRVWRKKHLQYIVTLLNLPERIRYITSIPVNYFYSTFFPKGSTIEGVRIHESASEFMTTVTPELDDIWYRHIDPYRVHPKGRQVETIAKIEPDVYCMTLRKGPTRIQSLFIDPESYPRIVS